MATEKQTHISLQVSTTGANQTMHAIEVLTRVGMGLALEGMSMHLSTHQYEDEDFEATEVEVDGEDNNDG